MPFRTRIVDLLPLGLWKPANLHCVGSQTIHFCSDEVRTIEWDGDVVALGRAPFPYDRSESRWSEDTQDDGN